MITVLARLSLVRFSSPDSVYHHIPCKWCGRGHRCVQGIGSLTDWWQVSRRCWSVPGDGCAGRFDHGGRQGEWCCASLSRSGKKRRGDEYTDHHGKRHTERREPFIHMPTRPVMLKPDRGPQSHKLIAARLTDTRQRERQFLNELLLLIKRSTPFRPALHMIPHPLTL